MFIALLMAVALPAQAISASVERVWNAAHYHLDDPDGAGVPVVTSNAMDTRPDAITEHYPLRLARAMALVHRVPAAQALDEASKPAGHDAHADAHHTGIAHHHDAGTRGVVYVINADEPPMSAAERAGKHDHDGFSPAVPVVRMLDAQLHGRNGALPDSTQRASRASGPGERPPR